MKSTYLMMSFGIENFMFYKIENSLSFSSLNEYIYIYYIRN